MNAMTTKELEAFRDMVALAESAAELFRIMSGKKAAYVGDGKVEIEFPVFNYSTSKHNVENTIRLSGEYLLLNMNAFIDGLHP